MALFKNPVWTVPGNHEIFGIERGKSKVSYAHPLYGRKMYQHYRAPTTTRSLLAACTSPGSTQWTSTTSGTTDTTVVSSPGSNATWR